MAKYGDTPQHDIDICRTCIHAVFIKGQSLKEDEKRCGALSRPWPQYAVTSCTEYIEKTKMTRSEMERIAWVVETNKKKEFIGFKPPEKRDPMPWED